MKVEKLKIINTLNGLTCYTETRWMCRSGQDSELDFHDRNILYGVVIICLGIPSRQVGPKDCQTSYRVLI